MLKGMVLILLSENESERKYPKKKSFWDNEVINVE
jgi:hypothetical protein